MYMSKIGQMHYNRQQLRYVSEINRLKEVMKLSEIKPTVALTRLSLIDTTIATNSIENIIIGTKQRAIDLFDGADAADKKETEFKANAELLKLIWNEYRNIDFTYSNILNMHKILMKDIDPNNAGVVIGGKNVEAKDNNTNEVIILHEGTSPLHVESALRDLIESTHNKLRDIYIQPLVVISLFVSEFLAIHPFNDGNGRLGRALYNLLLLKNDYKIPLHYSIDRHISENKDEYYRSLQTRSNDWNSGQMNVESNSDFIEYMLHVTLEAYKAVGDKAESKIKSKGVNKKILIVNTIDEIQGEFTRSDVQEKISIVISNEYMSSILKELVDNGKIIKFGKNKGTKYTNTKQSPSIENT